MDMEGKLNIGDLIGLTWYVLSGKEVEAMKGQQHGRDVAKTS
jgi:hypothetical protein